jgi:Holliday junction resolvasome RuvABC endonuclease subunit
MKSNEPGVVIGVDPGAVSGWAIVTIGAKPLVDRCGKIEFAKPRRREFRTASEMVRWALARYTVRLIAIEAQYFDANDPRKIASTIKLCRSAGRWEEAAEVYNIPHKWTNPATWQAAMLGARMRRDQLKIISQRVAAQRFGVAGPEHIADACHIGAYEATEIWIGMRQPALKRRASKPRRKGARAQPRVPS